MTYDDYRYELPDFILGKSPPHIAKAIERLIETDAQFRAEYLEMKALIQSATPKLNRAYDAPSAAYFETLSEKVMSRAMPKKATWWRVLIADIASLGSLFAQSRRWQWAGGAVAAAMALALVIVASTLDEATCQATLAKRDAQREERSASLVATSHFAFGTIPELVVAKIDENEIEEVLNLLEGNLPTRKQTYNVLSEDEAESLFNPM